MAKQDLQNPNMSDCSFEGGLWLSTFDGVDESAVLCQCFLSSNHTSGLRLQQLLGELNEVNDRSAALLPVSV